jgi:copper chaperone CopZ
VANLSTSSQKHQHARVQATSRRYDVRVCLFVFYFNISRGCQETVTNTLKELAGVSSVNVDLEKKLATVQANDTFDIQGAAKKVTDAGYDTTVA